MIFKCNRIGFSNGSLLTLVIGILSAIDRSGLLVPLCSNRCRTSSPLGSIMLSKSETTSRVGSLGLAGNLAPCVAGWLGLEVSFVPLIKRLLMIKLNTPGCWIRFRKCSRHTPCRLFISNWLASLPFSMKYSKSFCKNRIENWSKVVHSSIENEDIPT